MFGLGALKPGFRSLWWMSSAKFKPKRTTAASRGFLATARLSCFTCNHARRHGLRLGTAFARHVMRLLLAYFINPWACQGWGRHWRTPTLLGEQPSLRYCCCHEHVLLLRCVINRCHLSDIHSFVSVFEKQSAARRGLYCCVCSNLVSRIMSLAVIL